MLDNYKDYLNAQNYFKATDATKHTPFKEVTVSDESNEIADYFWYITEGK